MCLTYVKGGLRTAEEDIICYKVLVKSAGLLPSVKHGDDFSCRTTYGADVIKGKISIQSGRYYLCTNYLDGYLDEAYCEENFGFKFSYKLDKNIYSVKVNGVEVSYPIWSPPYYSMPIESGGSYESEIEYNPFTNEVDEGLHTYVRRKDAERAARGIVVEVVIPKGTVYYEGFFGECRAFASSRLTYPQLPSLV